MKFTNKKELVSFILTNVLGGPFTWIVVYILLGIYGVVADLIIFYVFYRLFKYFGGHRGMLSISPTLTFGTKRWKLF